MPTEHPLPTEATVKSLYAHAFGCAFEGCRRPLYTLDSETGARMLNSRVCHIHARREGGPRWNSSQPAEENRSLQNLILMCVEHAALIDIPDAAPNYPPELLLAWKQKQLEEYDRIQQGWVLDTNMVREAIDASALTAEIAISNSTVNLGGEGGKAPGAGGGGGGALGRGARGGRGGNGGRQKIDDGPYSLPFPDDKLTTYQLAEMASALAGFVPGSGGGGQGAIGEGAIGGDGGDGGDSVLGAIDIAKMREDGFHHAEVIVGKGGEHGRHGEATVVNFVTEDGRILKTIRAAGGKGGGASLPEGVAEVGQDEIQGNFRVTTLMIANSVEVREGLFFLLGADWDTYHAQCLPFDTVWPVVFALRWSACQWSEPRGFFLVLLHPDGREISRQALVVPTQCGPSGGFRSVHPLNARLDNEGIWTIRLHSGRFLLAQLDITVKLSPQSAGST